MPGFLAPFLFLFATPLLAAALTISGAGVGDAVSPDGTYAFRFTVAQKPDSTDPASNVRVSITANDDQLHFASASGADCSASGRIVNCTLADIAPAASTTFTVVYTAPPFGEFILFPQVAWDHGSSGATAIGIAYRTIDVTTADDFVAGSLRAAMDEANAGPCPCRIEFREPFTVKPLTPLPAVAQRNVVIDGNGAEINGSNTSGDGFTTAVSTEIRGLTIDDFSRFGIMSEGGVYAHDDTIRGNLRGIWVMPSSASRIENNVISDNIYSGIFVLGGADIRGNRIERNGASGIFTVGGHIEGNTIAHNHDFAIGVPNRFGPVIGANSMFDNGGLSVDVGMDGPSPDPKPGDITTPVPAPTITSATSDGTATTVTATITGKPPFGVTKNTTTIDFYESAGLNRAGYAEAEHFLGTAVLTDGNATLTVPLDLRGHYVTAIATSEWIFYNGEYAETGSSELSLGHIVR